jgi:hypothetical protein
MANCTHDLMEWQQQDQELHCLGWVCRDCCQLQIVEYHHQTWCRQDFCGASPTLEPTPVLVGVGS